VLALLTGCALTSRGKPLEIHWYTPDPVSNGERSQKAPGPPLRLGKVSSGPDLGKRIAYGDGAYQMNYYDDRRWTERPEEYVRSALDRTLLEQGRFQRAIEGEAPTLDVEVLSFQEITTPQTHAARVGLHLILSTDHVLTEDTVVVTTPADGPRFEDVVAAMARALDDASLQVAQRIERALPAPTASRLLPFKP
jgi:cholesterol transport system auxiliary component